MQKMNSGEKYLEKTTQCRTTISETDNDSARPWQKKHPTKRSKREGLLTVYLRMQDAKKECSSVNKQNDIFTLPCPDSLRRDIEVLQHFIETCDTTGNIVHEEVVIVTEETEVTKKNLPEKNNFTEAVNQLQEQSQSVSRRFARASIRIAN